MLKNYIKIAWRNLKRNRAYAAINVLGLSLGIACAILIYVLVSFHLSFDNFHANGDRIYRVVTEIHNDDIGHTPGVPPPFAKAFRSDFSFAEKTARAVTFWRIISIPAENKKFEEDPGFACAEPEFFDIFNFPLLEGDIHTALLQPNTAILTEKLARKYFGTPHAMGKVIRIDNRVDCKITGILKDIPLNTDRRQELYVSDLNVKDFSAWLAKPDSWGGINSETHCFTRLKPGVTAAQVEKAFPGFMDKYYPKTNSNRNSFVFRMQRLADMHFNPDYNGYADRKYLWALSLVGIFLVVTACVNFVNLATAQALNRSKEVGIRKVMGSMRNQIFWQFIAETALITFFAVLLAYGLARLGLPFLNDLFKTSLTINPFVNPALFVFILLTALLVTFLAGSYPGFVVSGFRPIAALKGKLSQNTVGGFSLRRILVIAQFAISQMLIIGTVVIAGQMRYSKSSDLGFKKEGLVMLHVPVNDSTGKSRMESMRARIAALPGVGPISFCMEAPASSSNNTTDITYDNRAKAELWEVNTKPVDDKYIQTFGLTLVAGRNFYPSDTTREFVVNESLVKKLGLAAPRDIINKFITINGRRQLVVGVVKDFYNYSFRSDIAAIALFPSVEDYQNCAVTVTMADVKQTLASIQKIWNDTYPEFIFKSDFLDERIARFYELDDTMLKLVEIFAGIAIFIGCLGLYGLVSFMALRKTKEIGVRKVLGAGVPQILWMFGKEFLRLLIIAFLIAAPLGWWAMHVYLADFKYKIGIGAGIFILSISGTLLVAALTVGYKSIVAAMTKPVTSLRTE